MATGSEESLRYLARTKIDGYIATGKMKHGERPGPAPRGPIPRDVTRAQRMARKLQTTMGAAIYATRKGIGEPVLGQIKQGRGFRQFLLRGLEKVRGARRARRPQPGGRAGALTAGGYWSRISQ